MNGLVPEYMRHKGTIAMFPSRPDVWRDNAIPMQNYMCDLVQVISRYETVYFFCEPRFCHQIIEKFKSYKNIEIVPGEFDDIWARDTGPSFVKTSQGMRCIDWRFNAWGGKKEGSYFPWDKDDVFALFVSNYLGLKSICADIVVEGGGIVTDGKDTIFTTKSVLLNYNRNPNIEQSEIEIQLKNYTGASQVIWLDQGLASDETDGHIDNVLSFINQSEICLAWTDDKTNPNYKRLRKTLQLLNEIKNDKGEPKYMIHKIPLPKKQIRTRSEAVGVREGNGHAKRRKASELLPASYINFYMLNGAVIIPSFGCKKSDDIALTEFKKIFTDREVIQLNSREPLLGGGGIHCLLHEVPDFKGEPSVKPFLSEKVKIRRGKSKIHGIGMFAIEPINKGEIVHIKGGHILSRKEMYSSCIINSYLPISDDYVMGARNAGEEDLFKCWINHSCDPNCCMNGEMTFVAIRNIEEGEELTIDYAFIDNEWYEFECNCGSPNCRHTITGYDWKRPDVQKKYDKKYFARYLQEKMKNI